jgi:hypothetical protein
LLEDKDMENVNKLMQMAFSAIIFCIGLTILFFKAKTFHSFLDEARDAQKEDVIYQQYPIENHETVSYAELIATLMQPLNYDIMIDTKRISAGCHTADLMEYGIQKINYRKSYLYDESGAVTMVVYSGNGG